MTELKASGSSDSAGGPVVLAPGLLCDGRIWAAVRPALNAPAVEVSLQPAETLDAMADIILAAAPGRFVLAGFSMGGMAALLAAARAPDRVAGLLLMSTHADPDSPERRAAREAQVAAADSGALAQLVREQLKPAYFGEPAATPDQRRLVDEMAVAQGPEVFMRHVRAMRDRPDLSALARRVSSPTVVLVGEQDRLAAPDAAARLAAGVPRARLTVLPGCGHFAPLERPNDVAAAINALTPTGAEYAGLH